MHFSLSRSRTSARRVRRCGGVPCGGRFFKLRPAAKNTIDVAIRLTLYLVTRPPGVSVDLCRFGRAG